MRHPATFARGDEERRRRYIPLALCRLALCRAGNEATIRGSGAYRTTIK